MQIKINVLLICLFCVMTRSGHGASVQEQSFSTSVAGMEQLLYVEQILIDTVQKYAEALQAKVNDINNLIREIRVENDKGVRDPEKYLHNPLNGYSLVRRMYNDWPHFELFLSEPIGDNYVKVLQTYRPQMPTSRDLTEASEAIYRLQFTYDLRAEDIAEGLLNGRKYDVKLSSVDRYYMGLHLMGKEKVHDAAHWIYTAIENFANTNYTKIIEFTKDQLFSLYSEAIAKQNRWRDAVNTMETAMSIKPVDARLLKRKIEFERKAKEYQDIPIPPSLYPKTAYNLGCRGAYANRISRHHCLYNTTTSFFTRLAPLKMEILSLKPYMVIYHDVISNTEIRELQMLAKNNLKRATVYNEGAESSKVVSTRTSKFAWFQDNTSATTQRINKRIQDMTGFSLEGAEMLQVMNYGLGGHYDTHYDFFNVTADAEVVRQEGDRIATVLFYLTDVEQGGATVFPNLKLAVFPRKGSAVFWHNLNNRIEGDDLTLHAACPVIVGSKWVCNKWIRSKAQVFRRPCYI